MNKEYRKILQGATDQLENMKTALAAEFIGTSPRSSISRIRFLAYNHQGPRARTRCGRPWRSWDSSGLVSPLEQARGPPKNAV